MKSISIEFNYRTGMQGSDIADHAFHISSLAFASDVNADIDHAYIHINIYIITIQLCIT